MKKTSVKDRILNTASQLFYEKGYNQTGINQIIEEAEVAKASLYQHFRSKEEIALAFLERRHQQSIERLRLFTDHLDDYREKLLGFFDCMIAFQNEASFRGCGFQNIITDLPQDHQLIRDQTKLYKNMRIKWLQDIIDSSQLYSSEETAVLANEIMILMEGALILTQIQQDTWPLISARAACMKLLKSV